MHVRRIIRESAYHLSARFARPTVHRRNNATCTKKTDTPPKLFKTGMFAVRYAEYSHLTKVLSAPLLALIGTGNAHSGCEEPGRCALGGPLAFRPCGCGLVARLGQVGDRYVHGDSAMLGGYGSGERSSIVGSSSPAGRGGRAVVGSVVMTSVRPSSRLGKTGGGRHTRGGMV